MFEGEWWCYPVGSPEWEEAILIAIPEPVHTPQPAPPPASTDSRGEQFPQTPPDSGECHNGISEWGFIPCEVAPTTEPEVMLIEPPIPSTTVPLVVETQVSVPLAQELPVTGTAEAAMIAPFAGLVLALGAITTFLARRKA